MSKSKIEWCDETINPIIGCSKISEGCKNCYAARMARRLAGNPATPQYKNIADWDGETAFVSSVLKRIPGKGKRLFVGSMGGLFHDSVSEEWINKVCANIINNRRHTFLILTKRPKRMNEYFGKLWKKFEMASVYNLACPTIRFIPNLWLGVTCENQRTADERIPLLLQTPAAKRFVSVEPMLEPISLAEYYKEEGNGSYSVWLDYLDWVICGAETGPRKRPMNQEWAEDLHAQCRKASVPFFGKKDSDGNALKVGGEIVREFPK